MNISPREIFHALLKPQICSTPIRDICVIRVQCNGKSNRKKVSHTLDLVERYDEETGFTAMEKLTGWHASMIAIFAAKENFFKGCVPVEKILGGKTLVEEARKRGWSFVKVNGN
jgi:lysine 6-dehydrogenase